MEELFEFDLSDVDVAAFESVVTPSEEPQTNEPQNATPNVQISSQTEEPENNHQDHPRHQEDDREQQKETPQPRRTQQMQLQFAVGQQPCKILLIPLNSTRLLPDLKNLKQLPQVTPPIKTGLNPSTTGLNFSTPVPTPQPSQKQSQASSPNVANEMPKRKPCNCTKSQCLKLYCDCFANGEFCSGCNCKDCYNSLSKEKERQKAITQCLERNPEAFRPKIGKAAPVSVERRHTKGCNCKRSGCLKNYCECYEAKILCSNLCKCCGCKNYEESFERKTLMQLANSSSDTARGILKSLLPMNYTSSSSNMINNLNQGSNNTKYNEPQSTTKNFINNDVIQASLVCLLQSAQQAEKDGVPSDEIPNLIQAEMGRCLRMIVNSIVTESAQISTSKRK